MNETLNELMHLILWALCLYGVTSIITTSYLLYPARRFLSTRSAWLYQLITCKSCCGFWVGIILSSTLYSIIGNSFFDGCIGSAIMLLLTTSDDWGRRSQGG